MLTIVQQRLIPTLSLLSNAYSVTLIITFMYLNCSIDSCRIGAEGGMALGKTLAINQTLQELRYKYMYDQSHSLISDLLHALCCEFVSAQEHMAQSHPLSISKRYTLPCC